MKQLSATELAGLASGCAAAPAMLLLDVREPWECALAAINIDGWPTVQLPMGQITARLDELDPVQPVVCVCHHGVRSAQVAAFLERQGFDAVYNLNGGIDAWSAQVDAQVPRY